MCIFHFAPPGLCNYELLIFHCLYFAFDPGSRISNCNCRSLKSQIPEIRTMSGLVMTNRCANCAFFAFSFEPRLGNLNWAALYVSKWRYNKYVRYNRAWILHANKDWNWAPKNQLHGNRIEYTLTTVQFMKSWNINNVLCYFSFFFRWVLSMHELSHCYGRTTTISSSAHTFAIFRINIIFE